MARIGVSEFGTTASGQTVRRITMDGAQTEFGHRQRIAADACLPTTDAFTPTGAITPTAGTACDFATARTISPGAPPLDNNTCLAATRRALTDLCGSPGAPA